MALSRRGRFKEEAADRFEPAIRRLLAALDPPFPDMGQDLGPGLALALDRAVRTLPGELPHPAFSCLARSGRFGLALAAACLQDGFPRTDAARALSPFCPSAALGVANHIFLQARPGRGPAVDWAFEMLALASAEGLAACRHFLRISAGRLPGLAHPLREAIWEGRVGEEIRALDPSKAPLRDIGEAAAWMKLLRPRNVPNPFASALAVRGEADLACRFACITRGRSMPEPGKTLSALISKAAGAGTARCVEAAALAVPAKAPAVAAMLARGRPEARRHLAAATLFFDPKARASFLELLSPEARRDMLALELGLVAACDPESAALAASLAGAGAVRAGLDARPAVPPGASRAGLDREPDLSGADGMPAQEGSGAEHPRDFSLRALVGLGSTKAKGEGLAEFETPGKGRRAVGRVFDRDAFRNESPKENHFEGCRFEGTDFSRSRLSGMTFSGCRFPGCAFDRAVLSGCRFTGCELEGCSFSGAVLSEVEFDRVDVFRSMFTGARLRSCGIGLTRFSACDFSGSLIDHLDARGSSFTGCLFDHARMFGVSALSLETRGVLAKEAAVWEVRGWQPLLMKLAEKTLRASMLEEGGFCPDQPVPEPEAGAVLDVWTRRREAVRGIRAHMAENARRLESGRRILGSVRAELTRLIPCLLHTDFFDQAQGLFPLAPPCRIESYHPSPGDLDAARRHFPDAAAPDAGADALAVEGVFTIGSFGTLAQTERSDLDIWILMRLAQAADADLDGLQAKLAAMERWAHEAYGVEVHFYLMDLERVAANDFGVSHEEGSGSAQAMLLKEEFYRTAVLLAGKPPLWWAAPPRCGAGEYEALAGDPVFSASLADLGRIGDIPRDEFFGASLWQIFKSIAAPYKSVMKFGLLERYAAAGEGGSELLCESIKEAMLSPAPTLWELDPYARLFTEVHEHYRGSGHKEDAALVRLAFLAKSELAAKARAAACPMTPEESHARDMYLCRSAEGFCFGGKGGETLLGYKQQARLGELVSRFIARAYSRLAGQADALGGSAITPEDMTRLGRRIMAAFSKRRHKVDVMPFAGAGSLECRVIYVSASRGEKNAYIWHIQAGEASPGQSRLSLVLSRDSRDLGAELAWLAANGVYGPGTQVSGDYTINPVTAKDIQEYLAALAEFFPREGVLMAGTAEALNPEAAAKAFVAVNLTRRRETAEAAELVVTYQTTWGELFVRTVRPKEQPPYDPRALVSEISGLDCSPELEVRWFKPSRSACPAPFAAESA